MGFKLTRLLATLNEGLVSSIRNAARDLGHSNIFNASIRQLNGRVHVTYRAFAEVKRQPFRAYYLSFDETGENAKVVDLTAYCETYSVAPVADPKLFSHGTEIWAVFNTGTPASGENDVYLIRLSPEMGAPQRCELNNAHRQRIEKNWAFASNDSGDLFGVYQLSPLSILHHVGGKLGADEALTFLVERQVPQSSSHAIGGITNGSQLVQTPSGWDLVAHKRLSIGPKRMYVGRVGRIEFSQVDGLPSLRMSNTILIHSFASLLPRKGAFNPNLLSATYFSGLDFREGIYTFGYGINDVDFSIANLNEDEVWR